MTCNNSLSYKCHIAPVKFIHLKKNISKKTIKNFFKRGNACNSLKKN